MNDNRALDIAPNNGLLLPGSSNASSTSGLSCKFNTLCNQDIQEQHQNQLIHENIPPGVLEKKRDRFLLSVIESATQDRVLEVLKDHTFSKDSLGKALITACRRGLTNLVQTLVHLKANVNYRDTNGNTPLLICVQNGYFSLVRVLLLSKADINAVNSAGNTALILSICSSGSEEMVKVLLEQKGININHQNHDGYTALMKAVEVKDIHTINILLEGSYSQNMKGSSSVPEINCEWNFLDNIVNYNGQTTQEIVQLSGLGGIFQIFKNSIKTGVSPLMLAIEKSDTESFNILLHHQFCDKDHMTRYVCEAFIGIFGKIHERNSITFSEAAMIASLVECGADVNHCYSLSPMCLTIVAGSCYMVELLCKHVPKLNRQFIEYGALETAARNGRCDILQLLLNYKADINRNVFVSSALDCALKNGYIDCARLLIQHGAKLNMVYALRLAVADQNRSSLKFLLEICQYNTLGVMETLQHVLLYAVELGYIDIIGLILDAGADINRPVNKQVTPLVKSKNKEVAQFLIQRGADVNQIIECGENDCSTTLMQILRFRTGCFDTSTEGIVRVLLENGASVNAQTGNGKMALMFATSKESVNLVPHLLDHDFDLCAATRDCISIVQMLVNHGADMNIKDANGNTALLHAVIELSRAQTKYSKIIEKCILEILISAGSDVNCQNHEGFSPLMLAASECMDDIIHILLDSGADVNAVSRNNDKITALTCLMDNVEFRKRNNCIESLLEAGANASYLRPHDLEKIIFSDALADIIPMLVSRGFSPGDILSHEFLWIIDVELTVSSVSPLCMALLNGDVRLARYFMKTLFLTSSDVFSVTRNRNLRHILKQINLQACVIFLDEITSQPLSLFKLSFVAVSSAVGTSLGRENRVTLLPLPQMMKDKLLFRSEDDVNMC